MTPEAYEAWYETSRGRWIGDTEYRLLWRLLRPAQGSTVLDVGCGTGHFTRRLAADGFTVTGADSSHAMIVHARTRQRADENYLVADARALPFGDAQFDSVIAITSLCFVAEPDQAVREMVRVSRRRVALGLLNRASLLYRLKGRSGKRGGYQGAHWDTAAGGRALLVRAGLRDVVVRSAIFGPGGRAIARRLERVIPAILPLGGFLLVRGDVP